MRSAASRIAVDGFGDGVQRVEQEVRIELRAQRIELRFGQARLQLLGLALAFLRALREQQRMADADVEPRQQEVVEDAGDQHVGERGRVRVPAQAPDCRRRSHRAEEHHRRTPRATTTAIDARNAARSIGKRSDHPQQRERTRDPQPRRQQAAPQRSATVSVSSENCMVSSWPAVTRPSSVHHTQTASTMSWLRPMAIHFIAPRQSPALGRPTCSGQLVTCWDAFVTRGLAALLLAGSEFFAAALPCCIDAHGVALPARRARTHERADTRIPGKAQQGRMGRLATDLARPDRGARLDTSPRWRNRRFGAIG